jgi:hypothetical protein
MSTTLVFDIPPESWLPREGSIGGMIRATSGIPASYVVRRDRMVDLTLRIREEEWSSFLNFLVWAQEGGSFTWIPRVGGTEEYEVTLFAPMPGAVWAPTRATAYPRVFLATLTLRGVDATNPFTPFLEI